MRRLLPLLALLVACAPAAPEVDRSGPLSFQVTLVGENPGSDADAPAAFATDSVQVQIEVTALGYDKEPLDWSGTLAVKATPAQLLSPPEVVVQSLPTTIPVTFTRGFGPVRIWVSDEGSDDTPGSYATGVTEAMHFRYPTVSEVQASDSTVESPMEQTYSHIRGWDEEHDDPRDLRVTAITNDGFYATDLSEPFGSYNSMFAFTFSRPDGLELGDRLERLSGIVEEFLGFTELGFPEWVVVDRPGAPAPPELPPEIVCDSDEMEKWESTVVTVPTLVSDFRGGGSCADYNEFGQWPAMFVDRKGDPIQCGSEDARVNVVNINTVPSFDFPECASFSPPAERRLAYLTGILRHNRYASPPWIIEVRNCLDFPPEARPADCVQQIELPLSGPRKNPQWLYRDIPDCVGHPSHR